MTKISPIRLVLLTAIAMLAFAANSILCREALANGYIGASTFTMVRIVSGAVVLGLILLTKFRTSNIGGDWMSAVALFGYAAGFSYAYISLSAGTGALILFGAVQATMIVYGLWAGERLKALQVIGVAAAAGGLVWLMLPGVEAPPLLGALLMLVAGISWGVYSLRGRATKEPTVATAGNFIRAAPLAFILFVALGQRAGEYYRLWLCCSLGCIGFGCGLRLMVRRSASVTGDHGSHSSVMRSHSRCFGRSDTAGRTGNTPLRPRLACCFGRHSSFCV